MSIKHTQVVERDTLNRAFVSKSATGTQIMAGSLRLLGGLTIDGVTTINSLTAGTLTVNSINASGTITATTFSGSGASLTNLPATSLTGTINVARMPSNILRTELAQTITTDKTFSTAANLYFAGGTTYRIDTSGAGHLSALDVVGTTSSKMLSFGSGQYAAPSDTSVGTKIALWDNTYQIGVELNGIWYDAKDDHKFYTNGYTTTRTLRANISDSGASFYNDVNVSEDLEVQGEVKFGGANEFPDPLLASRSVANFTAGTSSLWFDSAQSPSGVGAHGSLKMTASAGNAYALYGTSFPVSPGEWVTFSSYLFSTTSSKAAQLHIQWEGSATTHTSHSFTAATAWSRESVTGQAPATATSCRVRIDNDGGTGTVMYFAAFQVERGRGRTPFKPYTGGYGGASLYGSHVKLGIRGEIHNSYNDDYIMKDHNNGQVTLSAAGKNLYLGYHNTEKVLVSSALYTANAATIIASTDGKLYYQGSDIDARYLKLAGGTVTGALTVAGTFTASGTSTLTGNVGIGTSPHASYKAHVAGDLLVNSWIRTTGTSGLLFESYGGGWRMSDATWIRTYGGKSVYMESGTLRTDGTLEVGGTAANQLSVTPTVFNWRTGTLFSGTPGKISINKSNNTEHPLHVKSDGSYMGVNVQATADTDVNGFSIQRDNGSYNWHIARSGAAAADLVFFSGNSTSMSGLPEKVRFTNGGRVGIGVSSPAAALDVYDSNAAIIAKFKGNFAGIQGIIVERLGGASVKLLANHSTYGGGLESTESLRFSVNGNDLSSPSMYIAPSGYLGLGTSAPGNKLDVNGGATVRGNLNVNGTLIGMGNDTDVFTYNDSNNISRTNAYTNTDSIDIMGDGAIAGTSVRSGNFDASDTLYAHNKVVARNFGMEYNATEDSLDFVYYG